MGQQKVAFATLGCKVNQYESEALKSLFTAKNYRVVDFGEAADVYVINTCTVTHMGNRKSRQMIRRAVKANPEGMVVVTGCYAQTAPGEVLSIPGVSLVIGTADRGRIVELVEQAREAQAPINAVGNIMEAEEFEELSVLDSEHRTRAFLKIQEGCNNFCSYCIIPYARGPLRSRQPDRVVEEAEKLCAAGFKEIVLTGICIGTYGKDLNDGVQKGGVSACSASADRDSGSAPGGRVTLAGLVRKLVEVPGLARLRLGSVEPADITPELVEIVSEHPKVCKHLHIPLQSGSDIILKAMNRRYNTMEYAKLLGYLRYMIPGLAVTTDIIVGFPGEKEEYFLHTMEFVEEMEFAALHVFKFSPRQGTAAAKLPDTVSAELKERRSRQLITLGQQKTREFLNQFVGKQLEVIVEQKVNNDEVNLEHNSEEAFYEGITGNYLRVVFPASEAEKGRLVRIRAIKSQGDVLVGMIIE